MAPCRQLLMWSVPSIAVLLGIFWFRKKREFAKSDPGGRERIKSLQEELAEALNAEAEVMRASPLGKADRSIIKSAPIDILSNGIGSQRSSPLVLTDEEVDIEIEKIIRKKSVSNDKRTSANIDEYGSVVSTKQPSFTVSSAKKIPHSESFNMNESGSVCHIKSSSTSIEDTKTNADSNNLQDVPSEGSITNETQNESAEEQMDATQGELNKNNVEAAPADSNDNNRSQFSTAPRRLLSDRDSANHSPVDPLLASPSMCHFSDTHSEGSSDSGKGCSEAASPPPANMVSPEAGLRIYHFIIPQSLVGLLIGKHGSFVLQIKAKTGASVYVRRHPESTKQKICAIEGSSTELEAALDMIREKFPEKRFPNFCIEEINAELYQKLVPLVPEFLPLQLVESVNNETIMTCLVSAGHFFLQQPLHPTFPSLHALHRLMASTYQDPAVPPLPRPVKERSICAAPTENNWYRAQVVSTCEEKDSSVVKLVDFGGYLTVDNDQLKQIRTDFMTLPFQATEALLAFVKPANSAAEWGAEALRIMAGLTAGQLLHAQVAGYDEAGLPLVNLYLTIGAQQVIFLNRELVERGLAEWELPADA